MRPRGKRRMKPTGTSHRAVEKMILPASGVEPCRVFLIYAGQGKGKTRLCATAPHVLIIDTERGAASIRRKKGVKVYRITHFSEIDPIYTYLRDAKHPYESVALDTLTRLVGMALRYAMGEPLGGGRSVEDIPFPSKRDWGAATEMIKEVILKFQELPMNIIFTAHERTYESEEEELVSGPVVNPGVRQVLLGAIDITGRLYVKEVKKKGEKHPVYERRLLVGPHELYESKDRSDTLPRIIRNPNLASIIKQLKSNGGEK